MMNGESESYLDVKISSAESRRELRQMAVDLLREKGDLKHALEITGPVETGRLRKLFGLEQKEKSQKEEKIKRLDWFLKKISERIFASEQEERKRSGAKWEELKEILQQTGIRVPPDFDLDTMFDLSILREGTSPYRRLEQKIPETANPNMNGFLLLSFDGNTVSFSGQSIFLHRPKYPEAAFLAVLNNLGEGSLEVNFIETTTDLADVNLVDYYEAIFKGKGWIFETEKSYPYDHTISPGKLTKAKVLKELETYRRNLRKE